MSPRPDLVVRLFRLAGRTYALRYSRRERMKLNTRELDCRAIDLKRIIGLGLHGERAT